ncbi:MAG: response regulator, partial [Oscillospiraceae bacterium]|nr:response regulator [Oscillospiraceae bacterium]
QAKVNEELKEAAENAINAGKAKNDFLANMSHEIRTPINAVLGMNEMIMRESTQKQIIGYAANIRSAGRTLLSIINEILDFSKIESGKMEIVPVEYDVSSLINDIVNMIKPRAEKKKLEFITEIDKNIPSVLFGDDVRIRQVITNILTNAVKYTPEGSVRMRMKVTDKVNGAIRLEVSVSDTGIGIKEEDVDKLFNSFQRLDQEKNRNIEGTGLGITIVQRLLNMMGSELIVSSVYGAGSTFSFTLDQAVINDEPVGDFERRFKASAEQLTEDIIRTAPDAHILVVDDNETNLLVAKSLLKRTLVQLDTACSGAACISLLKKNTYDIVFLDHMMPEMDGIETLKRIKNDRLAEDTVFIALTANAIHGARQSYLDAGFDDYLSKPFTGQDIEKCLFGYIDNKLIVTEKLTENAPDKEEVQETADSSSEENELLDIKTGLFYAGGDADTYNEILKVYVSKAPEKTELIEKLASERSWDNYIIEVHALKSTSLTVGSKPLSELAKELESAGKEKNYSLIEEKNGSLLDMYRQVYKLGTEHLKLSGVLSDTGSKEETDISALTQITEEKAAELLGRIKEACDAFDSDAVSEICDEAADYIFKGTPLKPLFEEIRAFADDFEYDSAARKADDISAAF